MATEIGFIKGLIGSAIATAADGSQRTLQVGDKIFANELVNTGAAGAVEIEFTDGSIMDLGRNSQAVLDNEVFDPQQAMQAQTQVQDDVEALQQALVDGTDPTLVGEATAAGAGTQTDGNEGHTPVIVEFLAPIADVVSGFETTGPGGLALPEIVTEDVFDDVPVAIDDGIAGEAGLLDASKTVFEDQTDFNSLAGTGEGFINSRGEFVPQQTTAGNILGNDSFGANGAGGLVSVTYTGTNSGVTGSLIGGVATLQMADPDSPETGPIWTLTVEPNGDYTFTLDKPYVHSGEGEDIAQELFQYTIEDADGDTASATLTFNIVDDVPYADLTTVALDEDDLGLSRGFKESFDSEIDTLLNSDIPREFYEDNPSVAPFTSSFGNHDNADGDDNEGAYKPTYNVGQLNANFGADGSGDVVFNLDNLPPIVGEAAVTSGGEPVSYWISQDGHTLIAYTEPSIANEQPELRTFEGGNGKVVFAAHITSSGEYYVGLVNQIDHPNPTTEDNVLFNLDYTITDGDGDTAQGTLALDIDDDSPVIVERYNEELSKSPVSEGPEYIPTAFVDEDDIIGSGNDDNANGDDRGYSDIYLPISFGADGPADINAVSLSAAGIVDQNDNRLTSNGVELTYAWDADSSTLTGMADDTTVLTMTVDQNMNSYFSESYGVRVNLLDNLDHPISGTEDNLVIKLGYTATDFDGDSVDGTFAVNIDDDMPTITATQPPAPAYEFTITNHDEVSSAGHHNSYGYYIKDAVTGEPTSGVVVWDDVHDTDTVPVTVVGYTPEQVGFFIIPNGDNKNSGLEDNTPVTFNFVDGQWQAFSGTTPLVGSGAHVFFDNGSLNRDSQDHLVDNGLTGNQNWEDLPIPNGDGDFNDVNINVEWSVANSRPLTVDETELADDNATTTASATMALAGSFAISPGADGLDSVDYVLGLVSEDTDSGLVDTLSDAAVSLRINDGDVEGYVADGVVFTLTVDAATGVTTLTQSRAVVHGNPEDHDEALTPATISDGLITMTATVTDGDGDTAIDSIDVGALLAFEDDGPTAVADNEVTTDEDTAVVINVLANDSVGADNATISSHTQTANGAVVLNEDGTFTYTPSANYSGADSFSYTLTDGDGDTSTATVSIGVTAVADAPTLIVSVAEAVENTTPQIIDISNVSSTDNGFEVTAYSIRGSEATISTVSGTNHDGFGVAGKASGASTEIGSNNSGSERLKVEFANTVNSINVNFAWLSGVETAAYTFFLDGVQVGTAGTVSFQSDTVDGAFILSPGSDFDRVDFTAPLNDTDDYLVNSITFDKVESYSYEVDIQSALTDLDGSETLGVVTLDNLPDGITFDGSSLNSNTPLTDAQINQITTSVGATETSNSDVATTVSNVKVLFDGLDATGETADLLIQGDGNANSIIGGAGDDIIFGGAGDDSLAGGMGADIFVWKQGDVATPAHDTVTDFDVAHDELNLADLLSDPSVPHTIEGIATTGDNNLQLNIKDASGATVQEIELQGVDMTGLDANIILQTLLDTGVINDGI
jgi:T1SS-143 domain-containing protein